MKVGERVLDVLGEIESEEEREGAGVFEELPPCLRGESVNEA
jgi:hypothetical protein